MQPCRVASLRRACALDEREVRAKPEAPSDCRRPPAAGVLVCDGASQTIECPVGQGIIFDSASYGRPIYPYSAPCGYSRATCSPTDVLAWYLANTDCTGKSECTLPATTAAGLCPTVPKFAYVFYKCGTTLTTSWNTAAAGQFLYVDRWVGDGGGERGNLCANSQLNRWAGRRSGQAGLSKVRFCACLGSPRCALSAAGFTAPCAPSPAWVRRCDGTSPPRHTPGESCGAGMALGGFKLNTRNDDTQLQMAYSCAYLDAAAVATTSQETDWRYQYFSYFDGTSFACPDGSAMRTWRLQSGPGETIRFQFTCARMRGASACQTFATPSSASGAISEPVGGIRDYIPSTSLAPHSVSVRARAAHCGAHCPRASCGTRVRAAQTQPPVHISWAHAVSCWHRPDVVEA